MVLPLNLTSLERYYWLDDSVQYPASFPVELRFAGRMDQHHFRVALDQALARHPLLTATIEETATSLRWVRRDDIKPQLDWAEEPAPIQINCQRIDLRQSNGLRVWVRTAETSTRVYLQFHHACADGLAAVNFIEELLVFYHLAVCGPDANCKPPEVDVQRLIQRGRLVSETKKPTLATGLRDTWVLLRLWFDILMRRVAVLTATSHPQPQVHGNADDGQRAVDGQEADARGPILSFASTRLTRAQLEALRQAASAHSVTLNDLAVRDMFLMLAAWIGQSESKALGALRVNVPVNVRDADDATLPVANRIGLSFVTPRPADLRDRQALLSAVREQMDHVKDWKLALYFLGGLEFAGGFSRMIPWMLRREHSFATVVLSNLGKIFARAPLPRDGGRLRCGNLVLERFFGVPPIRPLTRAAFLLLEYDGELTVCARCDPDFFRPEDACALVNAYADQLRETAARGG